MLRVQLEHDQSQVTRRVVRAVRLQLGPGTTLGAPVLLKLAVKRTFPAVNLLVLRKVTLQHPRAAVVAQHAALRAVRLVLGKVPRAHLTFAVVTRHGAVVAFVGVRRHEPALRQVRAKQSRILGVLPAAGDHLELARVLVDAAFVPLSAPPAPVGAFEYFVLAERDVLLLHKHDVISF